MGIDPIFIGNIYVFHACSRTSAHNTLLVLVRFILFCNRTVLIVKPAVIKLFESENELKCKNRLHDFIETLCLFMKILEKYLKHFTISLCRYNYPAKFLLFSRKSYGKILENILKFYNSGP